MHKMFHVWNTTARKTPFQPRSIESLLWKKSSDIRERIGKAKKSAMIITWARIY